MTVSTHENAPPLAGWTSQPGRHCGEICVDRACPTCGEYLPLPASIVLAEN